jgi:hypothetical protein
MRNSALGPRALPKRVADSNPPNFVHLDATQVMQVWLHEKVPTSSVASDSVACQPTRIISFFMLTLRLE